MPSTALVTGAGSGIGWAVTHALSSRGWSVWAGARRADDLARLSTLPGVSPLNLELLGASCGEQAHSALMAAGVTTLEALVHSAGVGELGHLAAWSDADVQRLFETNVFAPMRLTRALLPLILAGQGRIVSIGSMGGSITQPLYGPYTMTKHALEAWSECLRQELQPHGAMVSIVQPGAVASRIGTSARAANEGRLAGTPAPFREAAHAVLAAWKAPAVDVPAVASESAENRILAAPETVADVVLQALTAARPQARYLVGTRWEGERVLRVLTERLIDAASSPGQQLSREALLAWVDAAWREREIAG
jgi:NAD(P)-dependent dehydrogenase (short-subunit alcohol dehydrogenase family)